MIKPKRHPFRTLFAFCFLLTLAAGVIGYASGWINFKHEEQKTTIEIETSQIKDAAEEAVETGKQLLDKTGEKVNELTTDSAQEEEITEPQDAEEAEATNNDATEERVAPVPPSF